MDKPRHFIREWRKHRNLNQDELAERVGVSQGFISKLERNQQNPDLAFLDAASKALGCSPSDLIERDPSHGARIWEIYDKMTAAQQNQLTAIAETIMKTA